MTDNDLNTRTVIVERDLPHSSEKIWRALTQPELLAEWLMKSDFRPQVGHAFSFHADWGSVSCTVLDVTPRERLRYSWAAHGLETIVTFTLAPSSTGTRLRMEQTGFGQDQPQFYEGAKGGWPRHLDALEATLVGIGA